MSVEALQLRVTCVAVMFVTVSPPGTEGAVVSAGVLTLAGVDCADSLFALSNAETR